MSVEPEPGQIREDDWRRWYVGVGEHEWMVRYEIIGRDDFSDLLTLPTWMFTAGMVGVPVGHWTGTLLNPIRGDGDER